MTTGSTPAVVQKIKNSLKKGADDILTLQDQDPYLSFMFDDHYAWTSNGVKGNAHGNVTRNNQ